METIQEILDRLPIAGELKRFDYLFYRDWDNPLETVFNILDDILSNKEYKSEMVQLGFQLGISFAMRAIEFAIEENGNLYE